MPGKSHENPSDWRSNWAKAALEKCGWVSQSYYLYLSLSGQLNDLYPYRGVGVLVKTCLGWNRVRLSLGFWGLPRTHCLQTPQLFGFKHCWKPIGCVLVRMWRWCVPWQQGYVAMDCDTVSKELYCFRVLCSLCLCSWLIFTLASKRTFQYSVTENMAQCLTAPPTPTPTGWLETRLRLCCRTISSSRAGLHYTGWSHIVYFCRWELLSSAAGYLMNDIRS